MANKALKQRYTPQWFCTLWYLFLLRLDSRLNMIVMMMMMLMMMMTKKFLQVHPKTTIMTMTTTIISDDCSAGSSQPRGGRSWTSGCRRRRTRTTPSSWWSCSRCTSVCPSPWRTSSATTPRASSRASPSMQTLVSTNIICYSFTSFYAR